jgi:23S rRNA (guanosine2251-2'-O)-methyltransferase
LAEILYGRNAVCEALRTHNRQIHKLQIASGVKSTPSLEEVIQQARSLHIPIQQVPRRTLDNLGSGHQGIALEVGRLPLVDPADILEAAEQAGEPPFIVALDHLEDPHNVGALLRTADAVGVHGVILPNRRSVGITPAVVKASAGATEHLKIAITPNLVQTLVMLKKLNVWVVGVERNAKAQPYQKVDLNMPLALVLGGEGKGLSRLVSETCDLLIEFPMRGQIESLNVSVAGALALYEAWRARQFAI